MTEAERKTAESAYFLQMPEGECGPLFLDSPHSCTTYPADFRFAGGLPLRAWAEREKVRKFTIVEYELRLPR